MLREAIFFNKVIIVLIYVSICVPFSAFAIDKGFDIYKESATEIARRIDTTYDNENGKRSKNEIFMELVNNKVEEIYLNEDGKRSKSDIQTEVFGVIGGKDTAEKAERIYKAEGGKRSKKTIFSEISADAMAQANYESAQKALSENDYDGAKTIILPFIDVFENTILKTKGIESNKLKPKYVGGLYLLLGAIAVRENNIKEVEPNLLKAIKYNPDLVDAYIMLGEVDPVSRTGWRRK